MSNPSSSVSAYVAAAVAAGYSFECPCGELLRSIAAARTCRKCRNYSYFPGRYVLDAATGEVVYGTVPTPAENAEAVAREEAREAAEAAYWAEVAAEQAAEEAAALAAEKEVAYWTEFFKYDELAESMGY